jgi:hypothetical protein
MVPISLPASPSIRSYTWIRRIFNSIEHRSGKFCYYVQQWIQSNREQTLNHLYANDKCICMYANYITRYYSINCLIYQFKFSFYLRINSNCFHYCPKLAKWKQHELRISCAVLQHKLLIYRVFHKELYNFEGLYKFIQSKYTVSWAIKM